VKLIIGTLRSRASIAVVWNDIRRSSRKTGFGCLGFPPFPQRTRKEWGTPRLYVIQTCTWNGRAGCHIEVAENTRSLHSASLRSG
jgi:hypothetical protein